MATFSLTNDEVVRAVLQVMGRGRSASGMDSATEADVRAVIRSGIRRFLFPEIQGAPYQWRWLEKHHAIPAVDTISTGTVTVSGGVVTLVGDTWPADITSYFLRVDGHILFVTERTDDTNVVISHTQFSADAGSSYEGFKYLYDLPSDFGEWLGGVVYSNGDATTSIGLAEGGRFLVDSSEDELRLRYAIGQGTDKATTHFSITSTPEADEFRLMLWPVPEPDAFIQGTYLSIPDDNLPDDLTTPGSTVQVPSMYAEAALESILGAAEEYNDDVAGVHATRAERALQSAIRHDSTIGGAYDFSHRTVRPMDYTEPTSIDFSDQII